MHAGYSPEEAQEPVSLIWRVTTDCSGSSTFGERLPTSVKLPPLRRHCERRVQRLRGAHHLHRDVRSASAGAFARQGRHIHARSG